jgi:hypothetical protein
MAFFSGGDLNDEKASRLFGVIGKLSNEVPEIVVRAASNQQQVVLKVNDIFDRDIEKLQEDSDYSVPAGSEDKIVEIASYNKSVGALGYTPPAGKGKPYVPPVYPRYQPLSVYLTLWAIDTQQHRLLQEFEKLLGRLLPTPYYAKTSVPLNMDEIVDLFTTLLDIVGYQTAFTEDQLNELSHFFNQGLLAVGSEQDIFSAPDAENSSIIVVDDDVPYDSMDPAEEAKFLIDSYHNALVTQH